MRAINRPPKLPPTKDPLTERELQILQLVAQGLTNDEIAAKLQLANRTQAALYVLKEGLAPL